MKKLFLYSSAAAILLSACTSSALLSTNQLEYDDIYYSPNVLAKADPSEANTYAELPQEKPTKKSNIDYSQFKDWSEYSSSKDLYNKEAKPILQNDSLKNTDTLVFANKENVYINTFDEFDRDYDYVMRLKRFHGPNFYMGSSIAMENIAWQLSYDTWNWNVYISDDFVYFSPTISNSLYWNYSPWRWSYQLRYSPWYYDSYSCYAWHSPYYGYTWGHPHMYYSGYYGHNHWYGYNDYTPHRTNYGPVRRSMSPRSTLVSSRTGRTVSRSAVGRSSRGVQTSRVARSSARTSSRSAVSRSSSRSAASSSVGRSTARSSSRSSVGRSSYNRPSYTSTSRVSSTSRSSSRSSYSNSGNRSRSSYSGTSRSSYSPSSTSRSSSRSSYNRSSNSRSSSSYSRSSGSRSSSSVSRSSGSSSRSSSSGSRSSSRSSSRR